MNRLRILSVVGARPNFMKIAPFLRALANVRAPQDAPVAPRLPPVESLLIHTGQHYDQAMSGAFFESLGIPAPNADLGVGSGTHAEQVGRTMIAFEGALREWRPDWVVVVGDINATCACAITAKKEGVKLAHIEAGLRSFDNTMPEEINRLVTDRLADLHFTPDALADGNLLREGMPAEGIRRVGNIMIDTLEEHRDAARRLDLGAIVAASRAGGEGPRGVDAGRAIAIEEGGFAVLTLHRPATVDDPDVLKPLIRFLVDEVAAELPLVWSIHPRTRKRLEDLGLMASLLGSPRILLLEPLGYREMLRLNMGCRVMLTDSGGLQEECCVLGTPCVTLRANTERPATLRAHGGTCELAGNRVERVREVYAAMKEAPRRPFRPPLWDGHTAERIAEVFRKMVA